MKHIIFIATLAIFLTACTPNNIDKPNLELSAEVNNGAIVLSYVSRSRINSIKQEAGGNEYPYNIFPLFYDNEGKMLNQTSRTAIGISKYESVKFDSIKKSDNDEIYFSDYVLMEWVNKTDPKKIPMRGFIRFKMGVDGYYFPLICKYEKEGEYINSLNCKNTDKMF